MLINSRKANFPLSEIRKKLKAEIVSLNTAASDLVVEGMADILYPEQNKAILLTDLTKTLKSRQSDNNQKVIRYLKALNDGNIFLVDATDFDLTTTLELVKKGNLKNSFSDDFEAQGKIFILSHSIKLDFISLLKFFNPYKGLPLTTPLTPTPEVDYHVGPYCVAGEEVEIGRGTTLSAQVYLGHKVTIGERVTIHPHVTIHSGTVIKDDVIIHSGTVIGGDGFGYEIDPKKKARVKIPQIGNVVIHEEVEIGGNCSIDRATIGSTIINRRVKIDNLVQIAHNVEVGEDAVIVSQVGIAGSSRLGKGAILGGQVGVSDHAEIGDGAQVGAQSGVMPHTVIPTGAYYFGSPVMPYRERIKMELALKKLIKKP